MEQLAARQAVGYSVVLAVHGILCNCGYMCTRCSLSWAAHVLLYLEQSSVEQL